MPSVACNLNELPHAESPSNAQSKQLYAHITQCRGWLAHFVVGLAIGHQYKDFTTIAPRKKVPSGIRESLAGFSSSAGVLDPINSLQYTSETFVLAEWEYWDETVRVEENAHSSFSRWNRKWTDQVLDEIQTSDEVGATYTPGAVDDQAQVYTSSADWKRKQGTVSQSTFIVSLFSLSFRIREWNMENWPVNFRG